jgi:reactive intermediate/imine deaminase
MNTQRTGNFLAVAVILGLPFALAALTASKRPDFRRVINLPGHVAGAPYSNGVLAGNTLYLAGTLGLDEKTQAPPPRIDEEARLALNNLKAVLSQAGMTMDDMVSVTVFCPDAAAYYDDFNAVYKTYFKKDLPARAFIGSGALLRGAHFEVMGVAVKQ